jgi:hypothetical protein
LEPSRREADPLSSRPGTACYIPRVAQDTDTAKPALKGLARSLSDPAFLAGLCHDLRGPLGAIGTWVHVLRSGRADAATQQEALAAIQRDVAAQSRLIEQLSDLSSALGGSLLPSIEEVDLAPVLRDLGAELRAGTPSTQVLADPKLLRQLLALLLPAGDAAPLLTVDEEGSPATLSIRGLARKGAPGIVGMTLARVLAELQGGALTTSPTADATAFVVRLPRP